MARIRSIKPEFPQSESMGNVSRDARLTFIQLWTLADDSGRLRGNSRMLASLLFPYDNDAPALIDDWLLELEAEGCLVRYSVESSSYIQLCNWLKHQKIDKPSPSKIPEFDDRYRILANPRESSPLDQGVDQGSKDQGGEGSAEGSAPPSADASAPPAKPAAPKKPRKTAMPDGFEKFENLSPRMIEWARTKSFGQRYMSAQLEAFVSYVRRSGQQYVDWDEALMTAARENWAKLAGTPHAADAPGHLKGAI